jgi:hypothetical protein
MRVLRAIAALLIACSASVPTGTPSPVPSAASASGGVGAPTGCAPALRPLGVGHASVTLLPHTIGDLLTFGMNNTFASSASSYPPGAQTNWWDLNENGAITRLYEWSIAGRLSQSPDGSKVAYRAADPSGEPALFVRDANGNARVLATGVWSPRSWPDPTHLFVTADDAPGPVWSIDLASGARSLVFEPPEPPAQTEYFDDDWYLLSGDAKWAMYLRDNDDDTIIETYVYDVAAGAFTADATPLFDMSLSPRGDLAAWVDGKNLRAMHLCDRRAVTLVGLGTFVPPYVGGIHWSPDGRFLTLDSGVTDDLSGPRASLVVDLQRGTASLIDRPWGFISAWSPDASLVVLSRGATHQDSDRLARITFK